MEADGTDGRTWMVRKRGERVEAIRPDGKRIDLTPEQARRGLTLRSLRPRGLDAPHPRAARAHDLGARRAGRDPRPGRPRPSPARSTSAMVAGLGRRPRRMSLPLAGAPRAPRRAELTRSRSSGPLAQLGPARAARARSLHPPAKGGVPPPLESPGPGGHAWPGCARYTSGLMCALDGGGEPLPPATPLGAWLARLQAHPPSLGPGALRLEMTRKDTRPGWTMHEPAEILVPV